MLLILLLVGSNYAKAQTASYSGVTSALDTTHFSAPQGIATDAAGDLFIADDATETVYEMVRTGPGAYNAPVALPSPASGYSYLRGVAIDSNGNLWVADFASYPATAGQVYELAFNTASQSFATPVPVGSGWQAPWAITADASGNVFVTDNSANTISEISNGTVTVVNAGAISYPRGIAVDSSENLYVIDGNTGRVMKLTPPYSTSPITVNNNGFTGPGDIALDSSGNIWVAEYTNNLVRELTVSDNYATITSWGSGLNGPLAVWPDADGQMLVSDFNNHAIKQIVTQAVDLGTVALGAASANQSVAFTFTGSAGTTIQAPVVVTLGATGQDFADAGTGTCTTTNGSANPYAANTQCSVAVNFQPKAPGVRYGSVELLDTSGNLLATGLLYGFGAGPQLVFNPGSAATPITGFNSPQKIAVDGMGNVFVVDSGSSEIFKIPAGGGNPIVIAAGHSFSVPYGIALDGAGNLFVSESGTNQIDEIIAASGYTSVNTLTPKFGGPVGLAVDFNGNLYIADASSTHAVEELTAASGYSVVRTLSSSFIKPFGVAVDATGNVFVADEGAAVITELVAVNGQVPVSPVTHTYGAFTSPSAISVDAAGNIYVADNGGGTISELESANGFAQSQSLATGASEPAGIAVDSKGNVYYTTNGTDNSVYKLGMADAPTLTFLSSQYQTLSADSPKSVIISNIGSGANSDLILSNLAISTTTANAANSFAQVAGSGTPADCSATTTLVSGSSCNLSISFTPQSAVAIAGTATLTDNTLAVSGASQSIALNGTGTKATPVINWPTPAAIPYGTALSATQLDATSTVAGTFAYTPATGTVLGVGTQTLSVTFTPTDTIDYTTSTQTVQLVVTKATPVITWPTPSAIIYGTALSSTQLDASSTVAGTFVYTPAVGTVLAAGTQTLSVTLTPTDTTDYTTATQTVSLVVSQAAAPTITWPTPAAITYSTPLSATQLDATTTIAGSFVYIPAAGTVLPAGNQTLSVTFNPTDSTDYPTASQTVQIVVNKATPTVTWAAPAAITYGTALSAAQLNASGSVPGTFIYTPAAGTILSVGLHTLSVTFTPTDTTDYVSVTQTVQITVNKATPTITWPVPAAINYGTPLSSTQLNASSTVPGNFVYSPAAGTVLNTGTQTLSVTLTPDDLTDYNTATQTVQITVNQATAPTITWATPAAITYGTPLGATQLDATTTIAGSFAYSPAAGTVLSAGVHTLSVTFTPTDTTDYPTATQTVQITVNKVTPSITWPVPAAITYNTALSATQLDATSTVSGTFAYTPAAGTVLNAGTQTLSVTLTPTDATDYNQATQSVLLTVNQAAQAITFTPPSSIAYGSAPITLTATGGGSGNPITFSLVSGPAILSGSTLTLTGIGTVVVDANQAGNSNYLAAPQVSKSINVTNATLTVTANNASRVFRTANPTFTGSVTGAVNGDTFTETFSTSATEVSSVGSYPIVPAVSGTNLAAYTVNIQNGTLTVTQAPTTTTLVANGSSIGVGQSVTLTATVASSTTGSPTGNVSFFDGSTLLGTGSLSSGTTSYVASGLLSGSHSITAVYSGDNNFLASSTTAATTITVATLDFTLSVTGSGDQSIAQGAIATYTLSLDPLSGNYPGTVSFTATGLPRGASVTFSPSTVGVTDGKKAVTVNIQTAPGVGANAVPAIGPKLAPFGLALILLPLAGARRMRRYGRGMRSLLSLVLLLGGLATAGTISGCVASVSRSNSAQSYTITVTATSGNLQHSVDVTLEVK